jgi:hypothetical protein
MELSLARGVQKVREDHSEWWHVFNPQQNVGQGQKKVRDTFSPFPLLYTFAAAARQKREDNHRPRGLEYVLHKLRL